MPFPRTNRTDFNHTNQFNFIDIEAVTLPTGRTYETPVGKFPSVTTVLGCDPSKAEGLEAWRNDIGHDEADKITKDSAARGEAVHLLAEHYIDNKQLVYTSELSERMFKSIKPLLNNINNVIGQEVALYSKILGIAGRVDCIAEYEGVLSIIDYKTSRKEKRKEWIDDYFIQTSCYSYMLTEMFGINIEQIVVIIANEDTPYGNVFIEKRDNYKKGLLDRIQLYRKLKS